MRLRCPWDQKNQSSFNKVKCMHLAKTSSVHHDRNFRASHHGIMRICQIVYTSQIAPAMSPSMSSSQPQCHGSSVMGEPLLSRVHRLPTIRRLLLRMMPRILLLARLPGGIALRWRSLLRM